ncbi:ABC transporter substrate-binding protein [Deinococcus sp.]|uniref:ABC transporter substrate-binding protein n=1 Tax=Deinococcus sp. TaxID=47478 RepID=UPI002869A0B9|nr:ABC transporter substrate-binding protein [Deinococcus sp.]
MTRLKKFTTVALGTLLLGTALAQSKDIIVIVKATNSPYWQIVLSGAKQAGKDYGVNVVAQGAAAESDIAGQISILENAAARKPMAIVISPTANDPLGAPIDAVAAAKIPLIMIDSGAKTTAYTSFLTTNNEAAGAKAADALAADVMAHTGKAEGNVAIMTSLPGVGSLTARDKGFKDQLAKKYPGLKVVANRIGDDDATKALSVMLDIMSANPNLVGVFADNLTMGVGVGKAIEEQKMSDKVSVVSFDSSDQLVTYLKSGAVDSLIIQDPYMMGYGGVRAAMLAATGKKLPKDVDTGAYSVTMKNMNSAQIAGLLDSSKRKIDKNKLGLGF